MSSSGFCQIEFSVRFSLVAILKRPFQVKIIPATNSITRYFVVGSSKERNYEKL